MPAPDSSHAPTPGRFVAWAGGAVAALASASLALLLHDAPLGNWLWQQMPSLPTQEVSLPAGFVAAWVVGLAASLVGASVHPAKRTAGVLIAAMILAITQSLVLALHNIAWEPLPALMSILSAGSAAAFLKPRAPGPALWFRNRVSPRVLQLLEQKEDPALMRPDQRNASVLTCRLHNENALREVMPARDFLKFCETFRATAARTLLSQGACLDPTESSGVRAFLGLPLPSPTPAGDAVVAAMALEDSLRHFAETHPVATAPVRYGIGIATGTLTAGLVGSTYTVLGDAVELSRWLAAETANYEVRILTDSATHTSADNSEDRPLEVINPPDGAAVEIFQLLGTTGSLSAEALARRQAFRDAIMLLRAGHSADALQRFAGAREGLTVPDPVLDYFVSLATAQSNRDAASSLHPGTPPASAGTAGATHSSGTLNPPAPTEPSRPPAGLPLPAPAARRKVPPNRKLPRRP